MDVIIKPLITEKMTAQSEKMNRYGFMVNRNANKLQIRKAVEELYGVKVDTRITSYNVCYTKLLRSIMFIFLSLNST